MYGSRIPDKDRLPFESDYEYYERMTSFCMERVDFVEGVN